MQANWWGRGKPYNNQQEQLTGPGFSMTNPGNVITSVKDTPMGYPSIYIGSYQTRPTKGSNLPKQISTLTSVPTIFSTNSDSMGTSNYVADYDVWLHVLGTGGIWTHAGWRCCCAIPCAG